MNKNAQDSLPSEALSWLQERLLEGKLSRPTEASRLSAHKLLTITRSKLVQANKILMQCRYRTSAAIDPFSQVYKVSSSVTDTVVCPVRVQEDSHLGMYLYQTHLLHPM